jgi:hypothetical protein
MGFATVLRGLRQHMFCFPRSFSRAICPLYAPGLDAYRVGHGSTRPRVPHTQPVPVPRFIFLRLLGVRYHKFTKDCMAGKLALHYIAGQMLITLLKINRTQTRRNPRVGHTEWARVENSQPVPVPVSTRGPNSRVDPIPVSNPGCLPTLTAGRDQTRSGIAERPAIKWRP